MQALEVDVGVFLRDHEETARLSCPQEQVLGVPAGNLAAQRLRLLDGEQRRMADRGVGDPKPVEIGEKVVGGGGHRDVLGAGNCAPGPIINPDSARLQSPAAFGIQAPGGRSCLTGLLSANGCGCSSGVEHDLAKVGVEGSNPFARSSFSGVFPAVCTQFTRRVSGRRKTAAPAFAADTPAAKPPYNLWISASK